MSNALTPEQQHSIVTAYSVPLPEPVDDVRVTWRGETEFLRSEADYYTADQMRSYATAVSAAKDAEIAGLRAELLKSLADNAALREQVRVLGDARPEPDCRTCASYGPFYGRCNLVSPRCTNADRYEPLPPVRLWRTT